MTAYISNESLRVYAELLIEEAKKATGYNGTMDIALMEPSLNYSWTGAVPGTSFTATAPTVTTWTTGSTGSTQTGTLTSAGTINYPFNGGTTTAAPTYWSYPPVVPQPTIGPVTVETPPAKEHFEKMVYAQIQMLNEAYNLGREHGKLEGLKEGSDQITRTIDDIMDTEILRTADEAPSAVV